MNKCEYCGMEINSKKFPERKIHRLCGILKKIAQNRNLTYSNEDSYPMMYTKSIQGKYPNLKTNSDFYVYVHEVVARLILGRDLIKQGEDDSEIVHHKNENKKDFRPRNLVVERLKDHVSHHKKK